MANCHVRCHVPILPSLIHTRNVYCSLVPKQTVSLLTICFIAHFVLYSYTREGIANFDVLLVATSGDPRARNDSGNEVPENEKRAQRLLCGPCSEWAVNRTCKVELDVGLRRVKGEREGTEHGSREEGETGSGGHHRLSFGTENGTALVVSQFKRSHLKRSSGRNRLLEGMIAEHMKLES